MDALPHIVGLCGVGAVLAAYALLQTERLAASDRRYSIMNALGAAAILFSLAFDFNLSAAAIEGAWLVISLFGVAKSLRRSKKPNKPGQAG